MVVLIWFLDEHFDDRILKTWKGSIENKSEVLDY